MSNSEGSGTKLEFKTQLKKEIMMTMETLSSESERKAGQSPEKVISKPKAIPTPPIKSSSTLNSPSKSTSKNGDDYTGNASPADGDDDGGTPMKMEIMTPGIAAFIINNNTDNDDANNKNNINDDNNNNGENDNNDNHNANSPIVTPSSHHPTTKTATVTTVAAADAIDSNSNVNKDNDKVKVESVPDKIDNDSDNGENLSLIHI